MNGHEVSKNAGRAPPITAPHITVPWVQLTLLTLAVLGGTYTRLAISPLQETMRQALGLTDLQMALLQGPALSMPMVLASIPLGMLIDRHNRVRLMFVLALLCVAGTLATAVASDFATLFAARGVVGLAALAMNAVTLALIADLFPSQQRGRALMIMGLGQILGSSAAFAIGGALAAHFGVGDNGWRWALFWLTLPMILILAAMSALREPARANMASARPALGRALDLLWRDRRVVLPLLCGEIMFQVTFKAVIVWGAPSLARGYAAGPDEVGAVMATGLLVSGIAGPLAGGMLADYCQRRGGTRRTALAIGLLALASIPAGLFPLMPELDSAAIMLMVFMTLVSAIAIMGTSLYTIVIPESVRGLGSSILVGTSIFFGGLTPIAVSLLSEGLGGDAMIGRSLTITCAATGIAGSLLYLSAVRFLAAGPPSQPPAAP